MKLPGAQLRDAAVELGISSRPEEHRRLQGDL